MSGLVEIMRLKNEMLFKNLTYVLLIRGKNY